EGMADFFLQKNISSYAIDLPKLSRVDSYYSEILRIRNIAIKDNPGKKIYLVGESLGGLTSFLLASERPGIFDGLICISPAFAGRKKLNFIETAKMLAPIFYNPCKKVNLPFDSSMCTRDVDCRKKLDGDPCEYRTASVRLIFDIFLAQARARGVLKNMNTPVLFLVSGKDMIVDSGISRKVFDGILIGDKTFFEFPDMYHALSIEVGKEAVFEELLKWIEKRL
ncbi:MAG: alpha/beta hydrolase, partial [Candidatus Omnitrophota bacterium]